MLLKLPIKRKFYWSLAVGKIPFAASSSHELWTLRVEKTVITDVHRHERYRVGSIRLEGQQEGRRDFGDGFAQICPRYDYSNKALRWFIFTSVNF